MVRNAARGRPFNRLVWEKEWRESGGLGVLLCGCSESIFAIDDLVDVREGARVWVWVCVCVDVPVVARVRQQVPVVARV